MKIAWCEYLGVRPSGGLARTETWPFASTFHWGVVCGWTVLMEDYEHGPYDTFCEAWKFAQ